jgi:hypothetical protein
MVYFSHELSSPEIIFEYVDEMWNHFLYYRFYHLHIPSIKYALIYHDDYGLFLVKEYDELYQNFEVEIKYYVELDENEEEKEEMEEEDSTEEDPLSLSYPLLRIIPSSHIKDAYYDIMAMIQMAKEKNIDVNQACRETAFLGHAVIFHFYKDLYIANILTKFDGYYTGIPSETHASSAYFLIHIKNRIYILHYLYDYYTKKYSLHLQFPK